ncbi:MAG: hypothetical protein EON60_00945 [Alphaproteobacteria bacterium]|nr:MAG: hypothetical protein EON60_00945 [Alphaproteobacteria bacterium]
MIDTIARLYVNVLEPGFYILLVILLAVFVLYVINLLRGGGAKDDILSNVVNGTIKMIVKSVHLIGKALLAGCKMLLKTISLIFATVRDFLKSEI